MNTFGIVFTDLTGFQLSALLAGAVFFVITGLRELKSENLYGLLYLAIGLFLFCGHGFLLWNLPPEANPVNSSGFWNWLIKFLAPAAIALSLIFGTVSLLRARFGAAFVKILFGAALVCCLYLLGSGWSNNFRGALVLIWGGFWLPLELKLAG